MVVILLTMQSCSVLLPFGCFLSSGELERVLSFVKMLMAACSDVCAALMLVCAPDAVHVQPSFVERFDGVVLISKKIPAHRRIKTWDMGSITRAFHPSVHVGRLAVTSRLSKSSLVTLPSR